MAKKKPEIIGYIDAKGKFSEGTEMPSLKKQMQSIKSTPISSNKNVVQSEATKKISNDIRTIKTEDTKKKNLIDDAKMVGKGLGSGITTGLTGVVDAPILEAREQLQKGSKLKNEKEILKDAAVGMLRTISPLANAIIGQKETSKKIKNIIKSKDKSTFEKVIQSGLASVGNEGLDNTYQGVKSALRITGALNPTLEGKVADVQDVIDKPAENLRNEVAQELQGYSQPVQTLTNLGQVTGNMVPSIAATVITKNPNIGRTIMAAGVKGNTAKDALQSGKVDLETANNMGTAGALTEIGTELMTGGLKVFGKGALDDVAKGFIDKKVGKPMLNFVGKNLLGIAGENAEEIASDLIGTLIERGTIDPNATYTKEDLLNTILMTTLSTGTINTFTGGYGRNAYRQNLAEMQESRGNNGDILNSNDNIVSNTNQIREIEEAKNNGQIDAEEANNRLAEVQNGTYEQNRIAERTVQQAQEQFDAVNQAEASGQIDSQTANIERQALTNTLNQMTQPQQTQEVQQEEKKTSPTDLLSDREKQTLNKIYEKQSKKEPLSQRDKDTLERFRRRQRTTKEIEQRKEEGLKNPELKLPNSYNDVKDDYGKYYSNADMSKFNSKIADKAAKNIEGNRYGRTKQQWYDLAKNIGSQADNMDSESLKKYAFASYKYFEPNKSINRQGNKNNNAQIHEWVRAVYEGAKVGQKVETKVQPKAQEVTQETKVEPKQEVQRKLKPVNTKDKVQNFRNSVANENIKDKDGFYKAVEKIIKDKDYNVVLDSSITNDKGQSVNALISNDNGVTIKINPKSERAGEILLMHEVTHGIETKEMRDLIINYAKKNSEFNDALESLKKTYGTEDVTPEVVADISGQLLGNQEFINSLSVENPSLFKKILDALTSLKNKLTGNSKYENFVRDLEVKYREAYRKANKETANQNLKYTTKFSKNAEVTDNEGRKLTKDQLDYYDGTKVVDNDGHLITVYHTTTNPVIQFNEFNPVGTPGYNKGFGKQVVNFFTNSKLMSGSYANQQYEMAETKRLNTIQEAQEWLDNLGIGDFTIEGNNVYEDNEEPVLSYKNTNQLLRNLKSDIQSDYGNKEKIQYEGYLKIENPFVVDVGGREWNEISKTIMKEVPETINKAEKYKDELYKLVKESKHKHEIANGKAIRQKNSIDKIFNSTTNEGIDFLYEYGMLQDGLNNYNNMYEIASKIGLELPSPETKIRNITNNKIVSEIENSGSTFEKELLDTSLEDFIDNNNLIFQEASNFKSEKSWFANNYEKIIGNDIKTHYLSANEWFELAEDKFTELAKDRIQSGEMETNHVVSFIIRENNTLDSKYDGVIFKNVMDYAGGEYYNENYPPADVYVTFNSNQFKAWDNEHPTSDPDIRYSKDADKWQQFLDKYFKARGTTTQLNEKTTPKKRGPALAEVRKEVEEKTNKTMSKHIETSSKATNTVDDIKNMDYDSIVYEATTNKKSQEQAIRELEGKDTDTNVSDIHAKFRGTERLTDVDSAKITELMKQTKTLADEAAKNNNDAEYNKRMDQFRTLKGDYAVALSESGQFIQYAKVIKELDPETQVDVLRKVIEREQRRGNKKYEDVTLNEDLIKKYKEAKTDEERDAIMEEIKDDTARQIKITLVDKANEFRFLSMLGNVKTHARNVFGNFGMYSLQSFKDGVATIGENVYNKVSKKGLETRSKTLKPATKEVSKFANDKVDSFLKDQKSKYNESRGMKGDLEERTKKFSDNNVIGKALNKASNLNAKALNWEDRFFSSLMTKQAMKGFLTANGIETNADIEAHPELVAQALDYALYKGKEATFHQDSTTATAIRNMRDKLYTGSGFSKLGGLAIDTTLPFVSTPANIAKNALEYTPIIGFGNINKQLQNAPDNMKANVFIDSISKQFMGGALMAVGAYLASKGLVKGSGDDDKEDKTEASLGNASYSIKWGNNTYDLSWLSPTAIPFFEGVEVFNAFKKANSKGGLKATDTADLIDTMFGTLNPMTDMSVLQSIERIITSITYGGNAVKSATSTTFSSYLQQYIPTLLSQIAQVGDTKQRNTNTGGNVIDKTIDQIKYKIPGARNTLPEKVNVWGDTNKTADNIPQRMFEAFLSPANRKDYKVDNTTKELERLARETDDTAMLPTVKNKKLRVNGEDHDLKGKDYVNLQKTYGKTAKKNLDKLIKSDAYKNADDNEKKSMVGKLYDYASYKAKEKYAKNKGINFDSGNQTSFAMIDAFGIPYEKYVENQVSGNQSAADMLNNLNEAGLSKAQKGAVMNYYNRAYYVNEDELYDTLENSNLSDKQKELIRAKYEKNITDSERERYQRADNIGVDYDLYTNFRSFVTNARGESRSGGPTKKQKVINWIQEQELTAEQKYNLYYDYINNQGIFSYYK